MNDQMKLFKPLHLLFFIAAVTPFLWALFLNQNLPFSTMDDPTLLYMAKTTPASKIVARIVNPLTPTWSYQFEMVGGAEQNSLGLRPIELLIWKILLHMFGYNPNVFFLIKGLYLSLISAMIFLFVFQITRHGTASFLSSLFFAATLPVYMSVFFISDFGLLAQFVQALAIFCFLSLWDRLEDKPTSDSRDFTRLAAFFILCWIGIKIYETVKILPFLCFAFIAFQKKLTLWSWAKKPRNAALLGVLALTLLLVIPLPSSYKVFDVAGSEIKNHSGVQYHWDTLQRLLLRNDRNAWESELNTAFFSFDSYLPFSLARNLGCLLCWAAVITLIAFLGFWTRIVSGLTVAAKAQLLFVGIWLLADIAALGAAKEADGRHLMLPLIPFTVFFGSLAVIFCRNLPRLLSRVYAVLVIAGLCISLVSNLGHQIYFRKFLGGFQIAQQRYLEFIYTDFNGQKPKDYEDLIRFMLVPQQLCIWHIPFIVDDTYSAFGERTQYKHLNDLYLKYGKAYVVTADKTRVEHYPYLEKMDEFGEVNRSLYTQLALRFKKKRGAQHAVYRFIPYPAASAPPRSAMSPSEN